MGNFYKIWKKLIIKMATNAAQKAITTAERILSKEKQNRKTFRAVQILQNFQKCDPPHKYANDFELRKRVRIWRDMMKKKNQLVGKSENLDQFDL